jgi:hypothetical protein
MKEFNIKKGKRIHPYVRSGNGKTSVRKKTASNPKPLFSPPWKLSLLKDITDSRDFTSKTKPSLFKTSSNLSLSIAVDYTNGMSPIKNQGNLGSCVSFAAAAMKEWQERKEHKSEVKEGKRDHRKGKEYDYSEAWIYWNCKKIDGYDGEGTYLRSAMRVLNKIGVPTEKAWPYSDDKLDIGEPESWASLISKWALIGTYYSVNSVEEAKMALTKDGPFMMGVPCFYDFFFPVNGVIKDPAAGEQVYGGHAVCLSGDTKIPLLNGGTKTIKELSERHSDETFEVYSCTDEGEVVKGAGHSPRKTDTNRALLKILLDNGEYLKCTEEHLIMKRDGSYAKAKDLNVNDSLMPLYREIDYYGYEKIWNNYSKKWIRTHRMVSSPSNKMIVHHKNFNKRDNCSNNLQVMTWDEHTILHSQNTVLLKEYSQSEKGREKSREVMNKNWEDKEFRRKMMKVNSDNGYKVSKKLLDEGRLGFQNMSKEKMIEMGHKSGLINHHNLHTKESQEKSKQALLHKRNTDKDYRKKMKELAIKKISKYNEDLKNGKKQLTQKQIEARRNNIKNINNNKELTKMRGLKTAYTRFHQDKYETFEEYLKVKLHNHKIVSIEKCENEDVYDITVDKYHNFAIDSGIFVHNCAVGYDDTRQLIKFKNSWSNNWGQNGYGYISYNYFNKYNWSSWACKDISVTREMIKEARSLK